MGPQFWSLIGWVIAASILGFLISAVFAGWMNLTRNRFLIPYVILVFIFLYGFITQNKIDVAALLMNNPGWGILAGALVSIFLVKNVKSQPASRQSEGKELVLDIAWPGLVYGLTDAVFLNVMPVVAVLVGTSQFAWAGSVFGKVAVGAVALLASLLVTLTYHLGYPEFRSKRVLLVLVRNSLITLAYLVSGNPLGSIISHPVMHIAAVVARAGNNPPAPTALSGRL
jgi:hypothetical protein